MIVEHRQYTATRVIVLTTSIGLFAVFSLLAFRLWPVAHRAFFPDTLHCGCSVVAMQSPWWLIGLASSLYVVFLYSLARLLLRTTALLRSTREIRRQYHLVDARVVFHRQLQEYIGVISLAEPLALTSGFFRPKIYISEGLLRALPGSEVRAVIQHERAHRVAADPMVTFLLEVLTSAWHWIPGMKSVMSAIYSQREVAADAIATDGYHSTQALSAAFLHLQGATYHPAVAAFSPNHDRLEKLLDPSWQPEQQWWRRRTVFSILVIVLGALSLSTFVQAETVIPPRAAAICHQAIVMCQQPEYHERTVAPSCSGMTCVTLEHFSTPAYATHQ